MEEPKITTPEEYAKIRQEHIVMRVYGGNDNLALETKEQLLMEKMQTYAPGVQVNFHTTRLDDQGRNREDGDGHTLFFDKVRLLEHVILSDMGLIVEPYC